MPASDTAITFGAGIPQGWRMDLVEITDPVEKFEAMTRAAREADRLGYDSIWLFDHFHTVPTPELETTFECFTSLAALARETQHVRLGQMATCNGYRNPALLAKMGSTIDAMSHGRFILGFGAGWYEHEYRAYGYGYPETRERMARFREATEIIHKMWTEDFPEFSGKYYTINWPINEPKGVQKPHPPLWIAGGGEQVTLKLVARWGDGCNVGGGDPDSIRQKLDVLRRHCDDRGRDFDQITRSTSFNVHLIESEATAEQETAQARGSTARGAMTLEQYRNVRFVGTAEQVIERLRLIASLGINYVIVYLPRIAYDVAPLQRFSEQVIPHVE
ncbi:MAG TPA: LLM class F420-dependent oxidoreductase [Ktedonobacterales bacterium]|nr:LLM class F420-dependent oxidoreductase [Ktedonobacterales bacterium]